VETTISTQERTVMMGTNEEAMDAAVTAWSRVGGAAAVTPACPSAGMGGN
jgi:hypothetical protein